MYWSSRDVFFGQSAVAYLEIKKGVPGYISGAHFQKCSKFSLFTVNISVKYLFTYKGGRHKPPTFLPKYAPGSQVRLVGGVFRIINMIKFAKKNWGLELLKYLYDKVF